MSEATEPNSLDRRVAEMEAQVAALTALTGVLGLAVFEETFPEAARQMAGEVPADLNATRTALLRIAQAAEDNLELGAAAEAARG